VGLFLDRLSDYRADATVVGAGDVPEAVRVALERHDTGRVLTPPDFPATWLPSGERVSVTPDRGELSAPELDQFDGALTGCAVAIAATGTIVLDGGPGQGRRALSLVPDHLVVVVLSDQVVGDVPDAIARLSGAKVQTWISGPSATSDIELNRVEGVHGPRRLDVIIVTGP
jgi:L-lactate dehydrogenase complex protein LldG